MIAWTIFVNPMPIPSWCVFWLLLPLCISSAVIYKTVRLANLRRFWLQVAWATLYMAGGLAALGAGLWAVQRFLL